jgi:hypothetical protein
MVYSLLLMDMHTGKLAGGCTSAGALYIPILRLKPSMTVPANVFIETQTAADT